MNEEKKAFAEALVDCWVADKKMLDVVNRANHLLGRSLSMPQWAEIVGTPYIDFNWLGRAFVAKNMRKLNDAMWEGRVRDTCIATARQSLGMARRGATQIIPSRQGDRRADWKAVK